MSPRPIRAHPLEAVDVLAAPVVDLAGIPFRLAASDLPRAAAVASLFRQAEVSTLLPRCSLSFVESGPVTPTLSPVVTVAGVDVWRPAQDEVVLRSPEGLTARSSANEIVVGGAADALARVFRNVCVVALTHLFAAHDRHLFHAGAFVIDDRAVLVLGNTGSGKSTLTYAAVRLGWPVLADDLVALCRQDGVVRARGMPRPISVPRDMLADGPSGGRPVPEDPRRRTELPVGTLAGTTHQVAGIVVTERGPGPSSTVESLAGLDALRHVLQASTSLADRDLLPDVLAIAAQVARGPRWLLRHGTDPSAGLDDATAGLQAIERDLLERRADPPSGVRPDGPGS
ncbi:MAG: hypothetical protein ACHQIG_09790 [Acidimicrobiia bacterium]